MAIVIIRTGIIYFALLLAMRLMGKRQLGEMELSEFVVASLIADLAAHPLQDVGIPMANGLVPILTLFCFEVLIAGASMKSIRLRTLLFGGPSILVSHGVIDQKQMHADRFTADELMQELRKQGMFDLSEVEYAILETDGRLNIIPYPAHLPPTAEQLGVKAEDGGYPLIVISEGRVLTKNLKSLGRDSSWLRDELKKKGQDDPKNVYLMTVNQSGQSYLAEKEGQT
ncbi:MAG: DUF421 domain-containing protein [Oscillospiraceae bacterium]|nr:DUF421 domain-containing protein [Oscillospiraceae bacterium]